MSKKRIAIKTAVYNVPPNPNKLNGDNEFNDFNEHNGNKTTEVRSKITFDRLANWAGAPKV